MERRRGEENRIPWREDGGSHVEKEENEDSRWIDHIYADRDALRANVAHPGLLHEIAEIYFGNYYSWQDYYGPENIRKRLPGHGDLVRAALAGLRGTTEREDVPCADEISIF